MPKLEIVRTCYACPEQYEVTLDDEMIGYLRLRHGRFYAAYPDVGGKEVYEAYPKGDGNFNEDERVFHIHNAVAACLAAHNQQ